jgi:thermitase
VGKGEFLMHKRIWNGVLATIAITTIFIASTVSVALSTIIPKNIVGVPELLTDRQYTRLASLANSPDTNIQEKVNQISESFRSFWKLNGFDKNICGEGVTGLGDFICADEDSMELVIGVDNSRPWTYASVIEAINRSKGRIVNTVSAKGEVIAVVADIPLGNVPLFIGEANSRNLARYVEPNMKFQALFTPDDPYWSLQWGPQKIGAEWAWNTTVGEKSVLVAVIDTGIDYDHPDLRANYVPLGFDWVNNSTDPMDDHGHGTHCAGIIAAVLNNSVGIAGLAQVSIMAEKGLDASGWGSEDNLAKAIIHAVDAGAKILSNSWGGPYSALIHDAVKYAYNHSVLIVAAAGNTGSRVRLYPAALDEVVAVSATDQYDRPARFTTFGEWIEVAAPGVDIYSTVWDGSYTYMSGTSMACPHVAGVAALIWSRFPSATRDWVRAQLRFAADDLGDLGFDEYYGYGRVNAEKAVEQAPPQHDLLIFDWRKPRHVYVGDSVLFNVTVLNFGVNDEQNVTVQLFVDENLVDSKAIDSITGGVSTTLNFSWSPVEERTYNFTLYIVPVAEEETIGNNVMMKMISVKRVIGHVVFEEAHLPAYTIETNPAADVSGGYWDFADYLASNGYIVSTIDPGTTIDSTVLASVDVLVIVAPMNNYSSSELTAIENWVEGGGKLLLISDWREYGLQARTIASRFDIFLAGDGICDSDENVGYPLGPYYDSENILLHPITTGVTRVEMYAGDGIITKPSGEVSLILTDSDDTAYWFSTGSPAKGVSVMSAFEGGAVGSGKLITITDSNIWDSFYDVDGDGDVDFYDSDNEVLALNSIIWLTIQYEHELAATLEAPSYVQPGESVLLNASVYNWGLNNETDVEFKLLINDTSVNYVTIPLLENGTKYTINFTWTPSTEGVYNVTAYVPPVPDENITINNVKTKFVNVQYPLINPQPGQYANYVWNYYGPSGNLVGSGRFNLTYEHYIEPYKIYITVWQKDPYYGNVYTGWMIVNTMNRFVEAGVWVGLWYPGWIETDVNIGSTINLLDGTAIINGTKMLSLGPRVVDCWEIPYVMYGYPYMLWYDQFSGLWTGMESINPYTLERMELLLIDTNVPVGTQYEHDLGVTLEAPSRLQPGETFTLEATVYNVGLNNESNVTIQLLINGSIVKIEMVSELVEGAWHTISYSWTPMTEGIYNITAYTSPVEGETVTLNNIAYKAVSVRLVNVALISANSELMTVAPILDSIGIGYDAYNNNNLYLYTENLSLLLKYKVVIFYNRYRSITINEYSTLESYLSLDGNLLVTGFDCLVSDRLLANLVRSSTIGDNVGENDLIVVEGNHPIMNGPYGSFPAGYHISGLYNDCDMVEADTTRGAITVAELADKFDKIIATEGLAGKVVFWNGDGTYDWNWNSECQAMFKNLISWFIIRYEHELVAVLQAPRFLEPGDHTILNATVLNDGLSDEVNVELQLLINGTLVKSEPITKLENGTAYTFSYHWIPAEAGKYNITVYVPPVPNENITKNNICSKIVPVQYAPKILAYVQYADYWQEYQNTLRAIESTFGSNYNLTELWDYTQLDSLIMGKDILLIPEQEYASIYTMQMIGSEWSKTLSRFLENGGLIILCDFNGGSGGTYGILTGAGLMSISWANYTTWSTLYLVDRTDPLAEGVSSSFTAPDGTVSFVTGEANVVVSDGTYPVVVHKGVGRGHIALLGFDFYSSSTDTERLLGNAVGLSAYIAISISPSSGSPGTEVMVNGTKATANGTVSVYWDDMFIGNTTADNFGDFEYLLKVPLDASVGVHQIVAEDVATGRTASAYFRVIHIALNPSRGPIGTKVTVEGFGFTPKSEVKVTFNDILLGYAVTNEFGNFTFVFNTPVSTAETQLVKAYDLGGCASAIFEVVDVTPLDVKVDVGATHFRGEIAEFYAQTAFKGVAVNVTSLNAVLYKPDGTSESLTEQFVASGLYKFSYTIPGNAETGTYTLVVAAGYASGNVDSHGTSFACFLISPTLTYTNAYIVEIRENITTVIVPEMGAIRLNLTAMNITLGDIFVKVLEINGTTAKIQTTIGVVNGTITGSVSGDIATIIVPGLGQIQADISGLKETQGVWSVSQYATLAFALVGAVGALSSVVLLRRRKTAVSG